MNSARQQITKRECTRAREGKQADMSKTSPDSVDKAGCVVVCCDTIQFASCEVLSMVDRPNGPGVEFTNSKKLKPIFLQKLFVQQM